MKRSAVPRHREQLGEFTRQRRLKRSAEPYQSSLEVSSEMKERLRRRLEDDLEESASPLVPPLSASAVLAPISYIADNVSFTIEQSNRHPESLHQDNILDRVNTIRSLHHRRLGQRQDIPPQDAVQHLDQGLHYHLDQHSLSETITIQPNDIFTRNFKYRVYEPWVVASLERIQRWYKRIFNQKVTAANKISNWFFDYLQYRNFQRDLRIVQQCCQIIQRKYRQRLKVLTLNAHRIQIWYRKHKLSVKAMKLTPFTAVRAIQRLLKGILFKRRMKRLQLEVEAVTKLQKHIRRYLSNSHRIEYLIIVEKFLECFAVKLQSFFRRYRAYHRCQMIRHQRKQDEILRLQLEQEYLDRCSIYDYVRMRLYCESESGKLEAAYALNERNHLVRRRFQYREDFIESYCDDILDRYFHIFPYQIPRITSLLSIPSSKWPQILMSCVDSMGNIESECLRAWFLRYKLQPADRIKSRKTESEFTFYDDFLRMYFKWISPSDNNGIVWLCKKHTHSAQLQHLAQYREKFPPPYFCCQCDKTFCLFTDYYCHFDNEQRCIASGKVAAFYKDRLFSGWAEHILKCKDIVHFRREKLFVSSTTNSRLFKEMITWRSLLQSVSFREIQRGFHSSLGNHCVEEGISLGTAYSLLRQDEDSLVEDLSHCIKLVEEGFELLPWLRSKSLSFKLALTLHLHFVECSIALSATDEYRMTYLR